MTSTTITTEWKATAVTAFLAGMDCYACRDYPRNTEILTEFLAARADTREQFLAATFDEAAVRQLRTDIDRWATDKGWSASSLVSHSPDIWVKAMLAAQEAVKAEPVSSGNDEPETPLLVQWQGIDIQFEPAEPGDVGPRITSLSGLPSGTEAPDWLVVGAEVKRVGAAPRYRRSGRANEPWSPLTPVGVIGKVKVVDRADYTILLEYRRENGDGITDGWVPWIDCLPVSEVPTVPTEAEAEATDPKDQRIAELEKQLADSQAIVRAARGAVTAWASAVNEAANEAADRQNYCSEYEDYMNGRIYPAGEVALRSHQRAYGVPEGTFSMPYFEERTKEFIVTGTRRVTIEVEIPASYHTTTRDEDAAMEDAESGDEGEIDTSDLIDAIRNGAWSEESQEVDWERVDEA